MTMEATHAYRHLYRALARLYGKEKRKVRRFDVSMMVLIIDVTFE